jgi:chromosome segregation ATPase
MSNTGLPLVASHRGAGGDITASSQSSFVSLDEPPKDYEMML